MNLNQQRQPAIGTNLPDFSTHHSPTTSFMGEHFDIHDAPAVLFELAYEISRLLV